MVWSLLYGHSTPSSTYRYKICGLIKCSKTAVSKSVPQSLLVFSGTIWKVRNQKAFDDLDTTRATGVLRCLSNDLCLWVFYRARHHNCKVELFLLHSPSPSQILYATLLHHFYKVQAGYCLL